MRNVVIIARRELAAYFSSPLAYVFIVIFLALAGALGFYLGAFFERGQADLGSLLPVPSLAVHDPGAGDRHAVVGGGAALRHDRAADDASPITPIEAVLGKFLAAWAFTTIAWPLTFPMWLTVNYLGAPDNGIIVASYIGSWLMAGAFLALSSCLSALTKNQVIAFIVGAAVSFLFLMSGLDLVLDAFRGWAPALCRRSRRLALLPHPFRRHRARASSACRRWSSWSR